VSLIARLAALEQRYGRFRPPRPPWNPADPPDPEVVAAEEAYLAALSAGRSPAACLVAAERAYHAVTDADARERLAAKLDALAARRRHQEEAG
jgi:hypothetical protein